MTEREIYRESFGFNQAFENQLFKSPVETLKIDGQTVSQLFLLPCNLIINGNHHKAQYIFAVCTKMDGRKKGYMEKLLNRIIAETKDILILRPSSEALINYYKKFGFKEFVGTDRENPSLYIEPLDNFKHLADLEGKTNEGDLTLMAIGNHHNLEGLSFPYTMP